jgi:hypothetical protein
MKHLSALLLYFSVTPAVAGGDYVLGEIASFSGENGSYQFQFTQTDRHSYPLLEGCLQFEVAVEYQRVPWFSWLPFVQTGHPSIKETEEAAAFLKAASTSSKAVLFGFMGYGLVPSGEHCTFTSRGLSLVQEEGKKIVLSYHDQT